MHYYRAVVDVLHDLAAGAFPGAVAAAYLISRAGERMALDTGNIALTLPAAWSVLAIALVVLVATGLMRLRYWKTNVRAGFLETKSQMAVAKHAVFVFVQLGAAVALWALVG
jgi:hypothetical protein